LERYLQIFFLQVFQSLKKWRPLGRLVKPAFPFRFELFLDWLRESPKRHAIRRIEDFTAAMGRDRKNRAGLREVVSPRKTSAHRGGAKSAELSTSIPPLRNIHLAKSGND
jgi:hypothetical protein